MKKIAFIVVVLLLAAAAAGAWYVWKGPGLTGVMEELGGEPFAETGNVTRDNPGQTPGVWYLIYEKPGAPALSAELKFERIAAPALTQGQRVSVEGIRTDEVVWVTKLTEASLPAESGTKVMLYFYDPQKDQGEGGVQCSEKGLTPVERVIPETSTPLRDAVALLLRGEISEEERARGIESEFPLPGVTLKDAVITDGVATLTFEDPQNKTGGGSCRVAILWHQIAATAKQFPSVTDVRFMPEELFQP